MLDACNADFFFVDCAANTFHPLDIRLRVEPVSRFFLERQDKSRTLVHPECVHRNSEYLRRRADRIEWCVLILNDFLSHIIKLIFMNIKYHASCKC
jgi:hypothetical protein